MSDFTDALDQAKRESMSDLLAKLHAVCLEAALLKSALTAAFDLPDGVHLSVASTPFRVALNLATQALEAADNKTGHIPLRYRVAEVDKPGTVDEKESG